MTLTHHNDPPELSKRLELTNLILEKTELAGGIGSFIFNLRTGELYWSRGLHRIYHTDPGSFTPMPDSVPPFGVLGEMMQRHYEVHASEPAGVEYERELELTTVEGTRIWARMVCHAEISEGKIVRIIGSMQDITERKKTETALRESEQFIHSTLDALSAHLAIVNELGTIIAVNTAWRQFAEANAVSADEVSVGVNYLSVCDTAAGVNAEGAAEFAAGIRAVMHGTQETYTQEYPCHSSMESRWFIGRVTRFSAHGAPYLVIAHENITQRKLAEASLVQSLRQFETMVDQAPVMVWITGRDKRPTFYNNPWLEFTGHTLEQELEEGWIESIHPDDRARTREIYVTAFDWHMQFHIEFRLRRRDGVYRWLLSAGSPRYSTDGIFEGYTGSCIDITERKEMEVENRKLSHVVEQSPALIIITDLEGKIDYVNPAFTKTTGYSADEVRGENLFMLNQSEMSRDEFISLLTDIRKGATWKDEVHFRQKNGGMVWVAAFLSPIIDPAGHTTHFAAIAIDITQHKRTEEALMQSNEDLRLLSDHLNTAREHERTIIAREVHDELGQVFTALKMELMTLLRKTSASAQEIPPRAYSIMQMIESGIKSVQQISSSLRPRILDDLGLIPAIEWEVEGFQNRTEIPVKLSLPSEEIAIGKDVSTAIFRIVQESLTNVLRHSGATQVAIGLHFEAQTLAFSISDNGTGITETQLNDTHSFGLIGIRERVRMLGGRVEINNNADGGMSVSASIPLYA